MNSFIFLLPYVLVLLLLSLAWKKLPSELSGLTFLITAGLVFLYPPVLFRLDELHNPPEPETGRCGMFNFVILFANFWVFLPVSLVMQFLFNYIFLYRPGNREAIKPLTLPQTNTLF